MTKHAGEGRSTQKKVGLRVLDGQRERTTVEKNHGRKGTVGL
jgi:hypothetical protein